MWFGIWFKQPKHYYLPICWIMLSLKLRDNCRASSHARSRRRAGTTSRESHQTIHWIFRRLHRPSETRDSEPIMTVARERLGLESLESRGVRSESSVPRPARRSQRSARWAPQTVVTDTVVAFAAFAFAFVAANGVTWVRQLNSSEFVRSSTIVKLCLEPPPGYQSHSRSPRSNRRLVASIHANRHTYF